MERLKASKALFIPLFFILILVCTAVYAETYVNIDNRTDKNVQMIQDSNRMSSIYRDSFLDMSLKDLAETRYTALTTAQQNKIKNLANTILESDVSLTTTEKLKLLYGWIVDNYYYYDTPGRIEDLSENRKYDNPYYLIVNEYESYGKVRARDNGYAATMIAFARTQGIPARMIGGYYNADARNSYTEWGYSVSDSQVNHVWVEVYLNGNWEMLDPVADSYKEYNDETLEYIENAVRTDKYFCPSMEDFSKTHVALKTYAGSKEIKYISDSDERTYLLNFLKIKTGDKTNGKRINSSFNSSNSATWFVAGDSNSVTDGFGKVKRIYWPKSKGISGYLNLKSFKSLEVLFAVNNNIKSVNISGASSLKSVNVSTNKISKLVVTGSKKLTTLRADNNILTYAEYDFSNGKQKAVIKAGKGGTFSVKYIKDSSGNRHYLVAKPKNGYSFLGWYQGSKKLTKKKTYSPVKSYSFTYVAKFKKNPPKSYIKVSISKQKLWYYKEGKLKYKSSVVTGQRYVHDTPKGTFSIRGKARSIYLIGPDYKSYVNYWMPVYGDIGLHDATWRWTFGGSIYTYNGSHGCINLPLETAKYIYKNVPTGTKVKVVD